MDPKTRARAQELKNELLSLFQLYGDERMPFEEARKGEKLLKELQQLIGDEDLHSEVKRMDDYFNKPAPGSMVHPSAGARSDNGGDGKSIGEAFVSSPACKSYDTTSRRGPSSSYDVKALLNSTGLVPESVRIGRIEPQPSRALTVLDVLATGSTNQAAVVYLEETTATNNAAETAEGSDKPESVLAFTERTSAVRTIATVLPITNQLLEDEAACRGYVDSRLSAFVRSRLDSQLLVGSGVSPNLLGLMVTPNVQTTAKGADPTPDAIGRAMDMVRVNGGYEPTAVIMHPNDWQAVRHLRTADGIYIWGSPADRGQATIWGLPVVVTAACTENTCLVGAFRSAAQLFIRQDVTLAMSDSHNDFFIKNQVMLRAEMRAALAVYRPAAFCLVTGV